MTGVSYCAGDFLHAVNKLDAAQPSFAKPEGLSIERMTAVVHERSRLLGSGCVCVCVDPPVSRSTRNPLWLLDFEQEAGAAKTSGATCAPRGAGQLTLNRTASIELIEALGHQLRHTIKDL